MSADNIITCPECGKVVGEYVHAGWMNGGKYLGKIHMLDAKYDKRKVSQISFGKGMLCKGCAKRFFPDGIAFVVKVAHGSGWVQPYVGIKRTGMYSTRREAEKMASEMNRRPKVYARVEEKRI